MKSPARVRFIVHNGKPIPVVDVTNLTPEEGKSVGDEAPTAHPPQPQNSVLALADFRGAQFNGDTVTRVKKVTTHNLPIGEPGGVGA